MPWFSTPFGRDGIITALEMLWLNPTLARGVLALSGRDPGRRPSAPSADAEPGKILHETRGGEMAALGEVPFGRYYGSVDATPLFVMLAGAYYRRTGRSRASSRRSGRTSSARSRGCEHYGDVDGDGFVEYPRRTPNGLVQQGWKDSQDSVFHADGTLAEAPIALCEVQGYVYAALARRGCARARAGASRRRQPRSRRGRRRLRDAFEAAFWCEELGTYALALDGAKRPCRVRTSNPGHCLFTGIADAGPRAARGRHADGGRTSSPAGASAPSATREARYNPMSYHNGSVWPHDNALVAAGLARYGLTDGVAAIAEGLFDASLHVDLQRCRSCSAASAAGPAKGPTLYPVACAPQAWAAGAVFLLLQSCLGLSIDAVEGQVNVSHARLPEFLDQVTIHGLTVGPGTSLDLLFDRHAHDVGVTVLDRTGRVAVIVTK